MFLHGKRPDGSADTPPPPPEKQPITVKKDRCTITLYDVNSLLDMPLANVRKLWKLMFDAAWENETTIDIIRAWLPATTADAEHRIRTAKGELEQAKADAESKRRTVAALGSTLDESIAQAKAWLAHARKRKKKRPGEVEEYKAALEKAMRPKTEHTAAVKEVKRAEGAIKTATAQLAQANKLQAIFNQGIQKLRY
jgi:hypothetical protein